MPQYLLKDLPDRLDRLVELCPGWRAVTEALAQLDAGLGDQNYVAGVLWFGLTTQQSAQRQREIIADRLLTWATRPGQHQWELRYPTTTALTSAIEDLLADQVPPLAYARTEPWEPTTNPFIPDPSGPLA